MPKSETWLLSTYWLRRGVCPAWNKVDCDYMWWVSAAVCCSCSHGVDFTVFFHIKCGCSQVDFISFFSDAIDHWMFWQCPNLSFFCQIWRKNQQSPVIYSVSIWHDLHTYIDRHEVYIYIYISHTPEVNRKSQTERRHMARRNTLNPIKMRKRWTIKHDTAIAWNVCTWHTSSVPCAQWTHQQRTMCTHEHTSSAPCVHINTPAAYHVYTSTHQQRTMCTHEHQRWPTPPHPTYHVYTSTHQQRTMCTHEHQRWHTPPHPTPPHMLKFRANPPGRPNIL